MCTQSILWIVHFSFFLGVLLSIAFQISNAQERNINKEEKQIENTSTVTCPGCENGGPCLIIINDVMVNKNDYTLYNASLILPPNDLNVFGNITCGNNLENLMEYLICPPINGTQYVLLEALPPVCMK